MQDVPSCTVANASHTEAHFVRLGKRRNTMTVAAPLASMKHGINPAPARPGQVAGRGPVLCRPGRRPSGLGHILSHHHALKLGLRLAPLLGFAAALNLPGRNRAPLLPANVPAARGRAGRAMHGLPQNSREVRARCGRPPRQAAGAAGAAAGPCPLSRAAQPRLWRTAAGHPWFCASGPQSGPAERR